MTSGALAELKIVEIFPSFISRNACHDGVTFGFECAYTQTDDKLKEKPT